MLFSVIVPIFNAEGTLKRCLESLVMQTFADFQVILVDDGSVDSSEVICQQYVKNDKRFKYIKQDNRGVSSARNTGISQAEGDYITFLDSDDIYYKNYFMEFYQLILKYPEYDNLWCGFQYISDDIKENGEECIFSRDEEISIVDRKEIMTLHEKTLEASPVNKLYKRSIVETYRIKMKNELSLGEDLLFNYEYLDRCKNTKIVILNKALYGYYCFSEDSLNHRYRIDLKEIYDQLDEKNFEYLKKWNVSAEQLKIYYNSMFYRMENVLRNTFRQESMLSYKEKYQYNNAVLKSEKFNQAMEFSSCYIHPLYIIAYRSKRYRLVQLVDFLVKIFGK